VLLVADASVLVPALADFGPVGDAVRTRLVELADGELNIIQNFTDLEVMSALRTLVGRSELSAESAASALRRLPQLPAVRHELTQPMRQRIWELRDKVTVYDAAYIALTERLQSQRKVDVSLATADRLLAATPGLAIRFEEFAGFDLD
jgi:predicted nucleic acid-binding protein